MVMERIVSGRRVDRLAGIARVRVRMPATCAGAVDGVTSGLGSGGLVVVTLGLTTGLVTGRVPGLVGAGVTGLGSGSMRSSVALKSRFLSDRSTSTCMSR